MWSFSPPPEKNLIIDFFLTWRLIISKLSSAFFIASEILAESERDVFSLNASLIRRKAYNLKKKAEHNIQVHGDIFHYISTIAERNDELHCIY